MTDPTPDCTASEEAVYELDLSVAGLTVVVLLDGVPVALTDHAHAPLLVHAKETLETLRGLRQTVEWAMTLTGYPAFRQRLALELAKIDLVLAKSQPKE